jgi:hypothetical protein
MPEEHQAYWRSLAENIIRGETTRDHEAIRGFTAWIGHRSARNCPLSITISQAVAEQEDNLTSFLRLRFRAAARPIIPAIGTIGRR